MPKHHKIKGNIPRLQRHSPTLATPVDIPPPAYPHLPTGPTVATIQCNRCGNRAFHLYRGTQVAAGRKAFFGLRCTHCGSDIRDQQLEMAVTNIKRPGA